MKLDLKKKAENWLKTSTDVSLVQGNLVTLHVNGS